MSRPENAPDRYTAGEEGAGGEGVAADQPITKESEKKASVQIMEPPVTERHGYKVGGTYGGFTIVKVEEKHGPLYWAIPTMPLPIAVICCIFNIVVPGLGTLISSFCSCCCGQPRNGSRLRAFGLNLVSALLQMLTFVVIVGWIWSIVWGMTFVQLSLATKESKQRPDIPYFVRRQSSLE